MGLALKIEEYPPVMMLTTRPKATSRIVSPPNTYTAPIASTAVIAVLIDRTSASSTLRFTRCS